ncbi:MAG: D-2-hydroxyacid dehydrogenase [Pyrinomonadaceae bacterium]
MERIVFLERKSVDANFRRPQFPHHWIEFDETTREQIVEQLRGASIAIVNKIRPTENDLAHLPDLKLIAIAATGVDGIPLEACARRGITVTNARNYAGSSVAEHVFMLMFALRRRLLEYNQAVRAGGWQQAKNFCLLDFEIQDLQGTTLGIIGYGALGRTVAETARAFGMNILIAEHKGMGAIRDGRVRFEDALLTSDVVSLHAPSNDETHNFIGAAELRLMKHSALLINTSRGALVEENALIDALRNRKLAGAGIDVLRNEPPRDGNPLLDVNLPNLIITPHVAWASTAAQQRLADQVIENIEAFMRGEPRNIVLSVGC